MRRPGGLGRLNRRVWVICAALSGCACCDAVCPNGGPLSSVSHCRRPPPARPTRTAGSRSPSGVARSRDRRRPLFALPSGVPACSGALSSPACTRRLAPEVQRLLDGELSCDAPRLASRIGCSRRVVVPRSANVGQPSSGRQVARRGDGRGLGWARLHDSSTPAALAARARSRLLGVDRQASRGREEVSGCELSPR